ncbi:hypothetical protein Q4Q35_10525 [Flavivirga aquimarina]|uniref:Uncharacterized protein n=1 Tax=Flavivirga aquimarina TaxID=2027862 RepID=A0ABT8WB39_9FLAO|nr:hypothetical protein [Flavivirga aquimarina]MDO5970242.1 hypothetical protein [Flavivirga aquimarina]
MEKTKDLTFPDNLNIPNHYAIIATLFVLLDKSGLPNTDINYCKMGLRVIAVFYDNPDANSRSILLSDKAFDSFFALLPNCPVNSRGLIPVDIIFNSVLLLINPNNVAHVD